MKSSHIPHVLENITTQPPHVQNACTSNPVPPTQNPNTAPSSLVHFLTNLSSFFGRFLFLDRVVDRAAGLFARELILGHLRIPLVFLLRGVLVQPQRTEKPVPEERIDAEVMLEIF